MSLRVIDLDLGYGAARSVIEGLSLDFDSGITALLGPNGCGKTTLLRAIGGALMPRTGSIRFGERDLGVLAPVQRARTVALIPQTPSVSAAFTVWEVVSLGRFALKRDDDVVHAALARTDLLDLSGALFSQLSAGQQQRVTLARALAQLGTGRHEARLLLADEPFAAMDPARAMMCTGVLRKLRDDGVSVVVVAHDFTTAARLADHAVLLGAGGRIEAHGPSTEVIAPEPLERAFGVVFERVETRSGAVVVPSEA